MLVKPVFLSIVTTELNGRGRMVKVSASSGDATFERLASAGHLTAAQSRLTGLSNKDLASASEPEAVFQDLLDFSEGADAWIAPIGESARDALRNAALEVGYPGMPGPKVLGLDELTAIVRPTGGRQAIEDLKQLRAEWDAREEELLKFPLPLLSQINWMLNKTPHPLVDLLRRAEKAALGTQFSEVFNSGKLTIEKLFRDYSKIIERLKKVDPESEDDDEREEAPVTAPSRPVSGDDIEKLLGSGGPLAKGMTNFEDRPEQIAMARRVAAAFNEGRHLMVEAGTGVGKSLAYLVPSILFAKRAGRPVIVSTHTKNLQSQLFDKDIPFLRRTLGIDFEAAVLKGRPNYLCLRKFMYTIQEAVHELDDEERAQMAPVISWATQTESGDVSELSSFAPEQNPNLWDRLHTVGDDCLKRQCPFYTRCFVYKARGLARGADVVVANHSVVFSDLNVEGGALPPYSELVFDEAHKLEDIATDHLSFEVTPRRVHRILNRLYRTSRGSTAGKGLLPTLLNHLDQAQSGFPEKLYQSIRDHVLAAMQATQPAGDGTEGFFDVVRDWTSRPSPDDDGPEAPFVPQERGRGGAVLDPKGPPPARFPKKKPRGGDDRKRFSSGSLRPDEAEGFTKGKEMAISSLAQLRRALDLLEEDFKEIRKRPVARSRELLKEISAQNLFLEALVRDIEFIIKCDEPNYVYWSERFGARAARVVAAPLDVAPLLYEQLYQKKRSLILTSATLSVRDAEADVGSGLAPMRGRPAPAADDLSWEEPDLAVAKPHPKSFEFVKTRLGLYLCEAGKLDELLLGSPFDYSSQCRLFVPSFLPEPGGFREKEYAAAFTAMVAELVIASQGRAMVLYTSYSALEASASVLRAQLEPEGIEVMAQGSDGSREAILARLKEGGRSVLLGTASFWEGVDVRGEALSLLVIAKLPFAVFTDPIIQGRCEMLEAAGKDPFLHFSVPQAILRLRQGFGRLIRAKSDRGIVVLADKRVLTKRYGPAFLRALPAQATTITQPKSLPQSVRGFLE